MKTSQAIRAVLASGLYLVSDADKRPGFNTGSVFFCHSAQHLCELGAIEQDTADNVKDAISERIRGGFSTLGSHLNYTDNGYSKLRAKYGHWHRHCFKRRVKWLQALAAELEATGD